MYQILLDGENVLVKDAYIFNTVYKILADKSFKSMTVELIEEEKPVYQKMASK